MKAIIYIVLVFIFIACEQNTTVDHHKETEVITNTTQDTPVVSDSNTKDSLVIQINKEKARHFNSSVSQIGAEINDIIFNSGKALTIEELLEERLIFKNNTGKMIDISIQSVIDTLYFE